IHRSALKSLRAEIEAVTPAAYYRFLLQWQHATGEPIAGPEALAAVLEQLEGYPAAASAWEAALLPLRLKQYSSDLLDRLCNAGRFVWMRLHPPRGNGETGSKQAAPVRNTPIAFVARAHLKHWRALSPGAGDEGISGSAE